MAKAKGKRRLSQPKEAGKEEERQRLPLTQQEERGFMAAIFPAKGISTIADIVRVTSEAKLDDESVRIVSLSVYEDVLILLDNGETLLVSPRWGDDEEVVRLRGNGCTVIEFD